MTDKQLRALSRKHLLLMIRDLEKELAQEKKEKEEMLLAYWAGARHKSVVLKRDKPHILEKLKYFPLLPGKTLWPCGDASFCEKRKE